MKDHWSWPIIVVVVRIVVGLGLALGVVTADDILTGGEGLRGAVRLVLSSKSLEVPGVLPVPRLRSE